MIESGAMGYTGEGPAGAAGGTAGAAGGAGESPSPLEGTSPSPDSGTWAGASPEPMPTPMHIEEVTALPEDQGAVESPRADTGVGQGAATQGGTGALGAPNEAAGSIPPGAGRGDDSSVAGAEDAAFTQGPMRQDRSGNADRGGDRNPEPGASCLGSSSGIDVAGTNATGAGASGEETE